MKTANGMERGMCSHLERQNLCPVEGCWAHDSRPDLEKAFGHFSNATFAAKLYREDPARYAALKREAIEKGMLPNAPIPKALQDD